MPKSKPKNKVIRYQQKQSTDQGAKMIVNKLRDHHVCVVHIGAGGGKTFMSIRAIQAISHYAYIIIVTTKKNKESKDWNKSIRSYNEIVTNSHLKFDVYTYASLNYKAGQTALKKHLNENLDRPMYVIADECQYIKNATSNNFYHIKALSELDICKRVLCLSATPISESLLDMRSYLILAGYYRNQTDFYHQHVTRLDKHFQPIVKDFNNVIHNEWLTDFEKIIERFKNIQIKMDTEKLLPTLIEKEVTFQYDKATQKDYNQIARDYREGVYESIAAANADQRTFIAEHADQRLALLKKIAYDQKRPQGPILVFYQYNADRDMLREFIEDKLSDFHLFEISGHQHYDTSQTPPEKSIVICQYVAAGEALNAKWSHVTVFYSPTYSWEKFKQAQGRNRRAYQGGTTYQIRFVVLKTINAHYWYDLIDNKKQFTESLAEQYLNEDE